MSTHDVSSKHDLQQLHVLMKINVFETLPVNGEHTDGELRDTVTEPPRCCFLYNLVEPLDAVNDG